MEIKKKILQEDSWYINYWSNSSDNQLLFFQGDNIILSSKTKNSKRKFIIDE